MSNFPSPEELDRLRREREAETAKKEAERLAPFYKWQALMRQYDQPIRQLLSEISEKYVKGGKYIIDDSQEHQHDIDYGGDTYWHSWQSRSVDMDHLARSGLTYVGFYGIVFITHQIAQMVVVR